MTAIPSALQGEPPTDADMAGRSRGCIGCHGLVSRRSAMSNRVKFTVTTATSRITLLYVCSRHMYITNTVKHNYELNRPTIACSVRLDNEAIGVRCCTYKFLLTHFPQPIFANDRCPA